MRIVEIAKIANCGKRQKTDLERGDGVLTFRAGVRVDVGQRDTMCAKSPSTMIKTPPSGVNWMGLTRSPSPASFAPKAATSSTLSEKRTLKDLQDAKGVIDKFDEMQFAVDSDSPDTTLRLSGKDLKQVIGTPKHTHPIEEVDGLPGVLEKKLDTTGGTVTGDLHVEGDMHVFSFARTKILKSQ